MQEPANEWAVELLDPVTFTFYVSGPNFQHVKGRHNAGPQADALEPPGAGFAVVALNDDPDLALEFDEFELVFGADGSYTFSPVVNTKGERLVKITWSDGTDQVEEWVWFVVENETPYGLDGTFYGYLSWEPTETYIDPVDGLFTWLWDADTDTEYLTVDVIARPGGLGQRLRRDHCNPRRGGRPLLPDRHRLGRGHHLRTVHLHH